jgi:hypothetical protein
MAKLEVKVEMPLKWPSDRPRIRFQDRKGNAAWKLSYSVVGQFGFPQGTAYAKAGGR